MSINTAFQKHLFVSSYDRAMQKYGGPILYTGIKINKNPHHHKQKWMSHETSKTTIILLKIKPSVCAFY